MLRKGDKFQKRSTHLIYRQFFLENNKRFYLLTLFNELLGFCQKRSDLPKLKTDLTTGISKRYFHKVYSLNPDFRKLKYRC